MAVPSTTLNQVEILFVGYFNRAGDPAGVSFWVNALNTGAATFASIAAGFGSSAEAKALYPYLASPLVTSPTSFVAGVYQNLLNRPPDAAGLTFWVNYLNANNGNSTAVGTFIATVIQSAAAGSADNSTLQNKAAVAADFSTEISSHNPPLPFNALASAASTSTLATVTDNPATVAAALLKIAAFVNTPQIPDLTIGVDNIITIQAGAVFNANAAGNPPLGTSNTLNTGDNLQDARNDGVLNYTAVADFLGNPPLAAGVTMSGIATANILNTSAGLAGFNGNITGLTTANMLGGTNGNILLGLQSAGLNTALQNINLSANSNLTAWISNTALVPITDSVNIGLNAVNASLDLNVTSGNNGYEAAVITSAVGANVFDFDVNNTSLAKITVLGSQALTMDAGSTALNIANLHTFDGSGATGDLTITFGGTGTILADGGSGNDHFTFPATNSVVTSHGNAGNDTFEFLTTNGGTTTFNNLDLVDGGTGTNLLILQADNGQLLGAGVGARILNIQTIEHDSVGNTNGLISADMGQSGSANVLDLHGQYNGNDVTITNLITTKSVIFTGDNIDDLSMDATTLLGQVNLTMAQTAVGGTQNINDFHVVVGNLVNLTSAGNADVNLIADVSDVNANVAITGAHQLNFGFTVGASLATNAGNAYDFNTGIIDASALTGSLSIGLAEGSQTLALGTANDLVHEWTSATGEVDHINLGGATGGNDNVVFHATFTNGNQNITANGANYTQLTGFDVANDVFTIDASNGASAFQVNLQETNGGSVFNPPAIANYTTGTALVNLAGSTIDMIKVENAVGGGFTAQGLFNNAMGATGSIIVAGAANDVLMAVFNNDTQQAVLMVVHADTAGPANIINSGDHVDVVGQITMTQAQFNTFGTNGSLAFV